MNKKEIRGILKEIINEIDLKSKYYKKAYKATKSEFAIGYVGCCMNIKENLKFKFSEFFSDNKKEITTIDFNDSFISGSFNIKISEDNNPIIFKNGFCQSLHDISLIDRLRICYTILRKDMNYYKSYKERTKDFENIKKRYQYPEAKIQDRPDGAKVEQPQVRPEKCRCF